MMVVMPDCILMEVMPAHMTAQHDPMPEDSVDLGESSRGGAKESYNNLHDTGQQGSKLSIVDKVHKKGAFQAMDSDGARADDANLAAQGEVQDHAGEMTATEQQESGGNVNQSLVDHAEQNIGESLAGGELESDQMELDDSMTGGGCYETAPEEEDNQVSTDAAQTTEMAFGSYNMDSGSELQPDMGDDVAFNSQQDELIVTQLHSDGGYASSHDSSCMPAHMPTHVTARATAIPAFSS
ncbi:hypothetical protein V6N11_013628 [Hibiscus sabdariffa]|uniref:Uncharacterized protein n=1 Tax=Hibiscus sabdariffa TaxID=183260 RepID=A0ABR1ZYD3_9ROSI